jgi:hypothetical protein
MVLANAFEATAPQSAVSRLGGFPYGLEPLTLPEPGAVAEPATSGAGSGRRADPLLTRELHLACRELLTTWQDPGVLPPVDFAESAREIYWFRWITGHQVSFIIWRLMAQADRGLQGGHHERARALDTLTGCVLGYCAMLLYTGSCTREIYNGWIRPSMYLQHRGFSGGWAPDYAPVRHLFRFRRSLSATMPEATDLRRALQLYMSVHAGVAAKLVPNGRSLLQQSGQRHHAQDSRLLGLLYDNYFMTLRGPVSHEAVVGQLLCRLAAIGQDVAANGLYQPGAGGGESISVQRHCDEVHALERDFYSVCFRVAGAAAGLSESCVTAELTARQQRRLGA